MHLETEAFRQFENQLTTLDLHVGGEPIRLLIDGLQAIPGTTINEKRLVFGERFDHVRLLLTQEPRGHRDIFAAVITEPVSEKGAFGIIFMDARRYPYMCGHGTIGAVTAFVEMGWLETHEPRNARGDFPVIVDTPSGPVSATVRLASPGAGHGRAESVAIQLESAFVLLMDRSLQVEELGEIRVDVVFAGGFFAMVSNQELSRLPGVASRRANTLALTSENAPELIRLGMTITKAANQQLRVQHPTRPYIDTIDVVEFYDPRWDAQGRGRSAVIYGEGHIDRSACGTGTSAKMALLHHRGKLDVGARFVNKSPLGSRFEGHIVEETSVGSFPAIVPEIRGTAHITSLHHFVVRRGDPFPGGFLL